jgi:hypothetical protein
LNVQRCIAVLALCLCACSSLPRWVPGSSKIPRKLERDEVPAAIQSAETALAANDAATALEWMRAAKEASGLPPEQRDSVQVLLERAADQRVEELSQPGQDPEELAELVELDLPRQIAVTAGMRAARRLFEDDEPYDAFELLKKLDTKFPLHHERIAAGDLMAEIGLSLTGDDTGFLGWFETVDEAQEILEYVILNAPWSTRGDECYAALSKIYENDHEWELAIDRGEKLVLNHPGSALRVPMQAHIPELRLDSLKSPEYDRTQLEKARDELEEWLTSYAGTELDPKVRILLADALRRLAENDLIISRFYARVGNDFGARWHAERARDEALDAGDDARAARASKWLESLPPAEPSPELGEESNP